MNQLTGSDYNGFNLITMDFSNARSEVCYYSNRSESDPVKLESGFYGVSNTVLSQPWPKAKLGKAHLEQLLNDNPKITPEELTDKLMTFAGKTEGSVEK
ncbi:transport and Golgi organization protein 2 homolog [Anneissia japonica]|uniref:transport and Golgi organization protein 2 homolog n=1 Tax=Anneissia japonica TaxID=1529436 RepID=UPI00142557BD|nr:transport and Golgi organization protein 2 homolog [Anneissia japonica]